MNWIRSSLLLMLLLLPGTSYGQENPADPCDALLGAIGTQPAWPGVVIDSVTGDTLLIQLKNIGLRRVKLAGIQAPQSAEPLSAVSRFHLSRLAKGLRIFVILDAPWKTWPSEVTAVVEDFAEAQLSAGLAKRVGEQSGIMGPYNACRCDRAEKMARDARLGLWGMRSFIQP